MSGWQQFVGDSPHSSPQTQTRSSSSYRQSALVQGLFEPVNVDPLGRVHAGVPESPADRWEAEVGLKPEAAGGVPEAVHFDLPNTESPYSGSHNERFVTPACSNQPTTSPNDTVPNAAAIAESNAPLVLAPTAFTNPSILLNANSMGSKSGPYPGNNTDSHPLASIASRTSGLRCTPSRSSTTICPGLGLGARRCSRYAKTPHQPPLRSTSSRHSHPHRG